MSSQHEDQLRVSRRQFLARSSWGLGGIALASFLGDSFAAEAKDDPMTPRPPHFPAKAKSVIYLGQIGAPSQFDLWDYKPELIQRDGKPVPDSVLKGESF